MNWAASMLHAGKRLARMSFKRGSLWILVHCLASAIAVDQGILKHLWVSKDHGMFYSVPDSVTRILHLGKRPMHGLMVTFHSYTA